MLICTISRDIIPIRTSAVLSFKPRLFLLHPLLPFFLLPSSSSHHFFSIRFIHSPVNSLFHLTYSTRSYSVLHLCPWSLSRTWVQRRKPIVFVESVVTLPRPRLAFFSRPTASLLERRTTA